VWQFSYSSETVRAADEVTMVLALWDDDDIDAWTHSVSGWPRSWYEPDWVDINPDSGYRLMLKVNLRTAEVSRWTGRAWTAIGRLGDTIVSAGTESGQGEIQFRVLGIYVPPSVPEPPHTPVNLSPGTALRPGSTVALQPQLFASLYSDPNGDAQKDSEWEVSAEDGTVVFHALGGAHIMQDVGTLLAPATTYRWRVRYQDITDRWSAWSEPSAFETDRPPDRPVNQSPPGGATGQPQRPMLAASAYHDPELHLHGASEWDVGMILVRNGEALVLPVYHEVTAAASSQTLGEDLEPSGTYLWRVRYRDALGAWSEWSERTTFSTAAGAPVTSLPTLVPLLATEVPAQPVFTPAATPTRTPTPTPTATPAPRPEMAVLAPNGGDVLVAGGTAAVKWNSTDTEIASVDVDYSIDGGGTWFSAARGLQNTGFYPWSVPALESSACLVKVIGFDASGARVAEDVSDEFFAIVLPTPTVGPTPEVQVWAPKLGEAWAVGTLHDIFWATSGQGIAYVDIYYSTDAGTSMRPVAHKEADDGAYTWLVPATPSQMALVRVLAYNDKGEFLALGDSALFTIYGQ
jgi:hypothetical protein